MNRAEFALWFAEHQRRFSVLEDGDGPDFLRAFAARQVTKHEADEASFTLLQNGCRFRSDNLPAMIRIIMDRRTKAKTPGEKVDCETCLGAGLVVVPHKDRIENHRWDGKTTMAVLCGCGNLEMTHCMTLASYESLYPDWPLMVRAAKRAKAQCAGLNPDTLEAEHAFITGELQRGEINLAEAKRRAAEPWQDAATERKRQEEEAKRNERQRRREVEVELEARRQTPEGATDAPIREGKDETADRHEPHRGGVPAPA